MSRTSAAPARGKEEGLRPGRKVSRPASAPSRKAERPRAAVAALEEHPVALHVQSRDGVCCHFWVIDLVQGPTSHGVCKRCDERRRFSNYLRPSGMLPEKDMSRLSDVPEPAAGDIAKVVQRQTGEYAAASAGASGYGRKPWAYPRRGRGLIPR